VYVSHQPAPKPAPVPAAEAQPMLTEEEKMDRESRRARAARFGVAFEEDVAVARRAAQALGKRWTIADKKVAAQCFPSHSWRSSHRGWLGRACVL